MSRFGYDGINVADILETNVRMQQYKRNKTYVKEMIKCSEDNRY